MYFMERGRNEKNIHKTLIIILRVRCSAIQASIKKSKILDLYYIYIYMYHWHIYIYVLLTLSTWCCLRNTSSPFVLLTLLAQVLPRLKTLCQWSMTLTGKAAGECRQQPPLPSAQGLRNSTCRFLAFAFADKMGPPCLGICSSQNGHRFYRFWLFK